MTTVAWDGKSMAADTLGDLCGLAMPTRKIFRNDRLVMGCSGRHDMALELWEEIRQRPEHEILSSRLLASFDRDDLPGSILVFRSAPSHGMYLCGNRFTRIERGFHAVGSGRDFALAAMAMGRTAKEAVELASTLDAYTGLEIESLEIAQC